jgi:hypothetical protein
MFLMQLAHAVQQMAWQRVSGATASSNQNDCNKSTINTLRRVKRLESTYALAFNPGMKPA